MDMAKRAIRLGLASAALISHLGLCSAQATVVRPMAVQPLQQQAGPSTPALASVMEARARAVTLAPRAPIVASEMGALQAAMANAACYPVNPTYWPHGLLPSNFSSSPTTPYPQATWAPGSNASGVINYVIQRAVIGTTNWTTVATTCGGSPSIWNGFNPGTRSRTTYFVDSSGGLQPATTYVYKVTAVDQQNRTDWMSFQWTSQPSLPTVQVTNYQHSGNTITFTAAQFYDVAGQVVASADQLQVTPGYAAAFALWRGNGCVPGSYGLVCQVKTVAPVYNHDVPAAVAARAAAAGVTLTFQWGMQFPDGIHVLAQSGITIATP